jgi:chromate reductase, NAD(P)H dehydrogenase (quinone)
MSTQQSTSTVLAISGSLRRDSLNTKLLGEAERFAPPTMRLVRFRTLEDLPHFNEDNEFPTPAPVLDLRSRVQEASGLLIATPEYNASVPGALKNAIDWLSRPNQYAPSPLAGKPVAIVGASQGPMGTVRAQLALRQILQKVDAVVVQQPEFMLSAAHTVLDGPTGLEAASTSADILRKVLDQLLHLIVATARKQTTDNDLVGSISSGCGGHPPTTRCIERAPGRTTSGVTSSFSPQQPRVVDPRLRAKD